MKSTFHEAPTPYCIATRDSITYRAKNNLVFMALVGMCYLAMTMEMITTENPLYFLGVLGLFLITKNPLETRLNYIKGLNDNPKLFSINLRIMRIMIVDGHVFSPPAKIAELAHNKFTQFSQ